MNGVERMTKAMYVGSFDPLTNGHLNIIERAAELFDELIVVISVSTSKNYLFTLDERLDMVEKAVKKTGVQNTSIMSYDGLTAGLAKDQGANVLVRGIRSVKDMEYEVDIATLNKMQHETLETVFLISDERYRSISSTMVKEIAFYHGELGQLVPEHVKEALIPKFNKGR